jgi:hypothetical protein
MTRRTTIRSATLASVLGALLASISPAAALGPVDGEVGAVYWFNDFEAPGISEDAGAPGFRAELWFVERFGVRGARFSSDPDDLGSGASSDYTSIDLLWRALSAAENSFLAVGAGWEEIDLSSIGLDGDTSGVRLSLEGRLGLIGAIYGYAQLSYLPALDDAPSVVPGLRFDEMTGLEYEAGVSWKMAPFVSLRAGYRRNSVDFTLDDGLPGSDPEDTAESAGFLAGLGLHF